MYCFYWKFIDPTLMLEDIHLQAIVSQQLSNKTTVWEYSRTHHIPSKVVILTTASWNMLIEPQKGKLNLIEKKRKNSGWLYDEWLCVIKRTLNSGGKVNTHANQAWCHHIGRLLPCNGCSRKLPWHHTSREIATLPHLTCSKNGSYVRQHS